MLYTRRFIFRFETEGPSAIRTLTTYLTKGATSHIANHLNNNYTGQIPDIVGDHTTHTIDAWFGYKEPHNLKYSFAMQSLNNHVAPPPLVTLSTANLIRRLVPDVKLIIATRDPVERFYSLYKMHEATSPEDFHNGAVNGINWWKSCINEGVPLGDCMYGVPHLDTYEPINCTWHGRATASARRSIYVLYMKEWFDVFPRDQFLLIRFEDYVDKEVETINNVVFPFLNLTKLDSNGKRKMASVTIRHPKGSSTKNSAGKKINYNYHVPMLNKTRSLLREFYKPYNEQLAQLLNDTRYLWGY